MQVSVIPCEIQAGVEEACTIREPLEKVFQWVDIDKPVVVYLYETMDRAKESIHAYYEDKGDHGFETRQLIWSVVYERWNNIECTPSPYSCCKNLPQPNILLHPWIYI